MSDPQQDSYITERQACGGLLAVQLSHLGSSFASESRRARFLREPQAAAGLRHPNIVPVYDAGVEGDQFYIASAFVDGQILQTRLEENRPDFRQMARMLIDQEPPSPRTHNPAITRDLETICQKATLFQPDSQRCSNLDIGPTIGRSTTWQRRSPAARMGVALSVAAGESKRQRIEV